MRALVSDVRLGPGRALPSLPESGVQVRNGSGMLGGSAVPPM